MAEPARHTSRLAAAAVTIAFLFCPAAASATHLTATGSSGGPTVPWGFNEDWGFAQGGWSDETTIRHLQLAGAIMPDALSANRFHVQWAQVERLPGSYDWTMTDAVYRAMQEHTARPVMLIYNTPEWARDPTARCPAAEACAYPPLSLWDSQWKRFVQAAVSRYPDVRAIEIWNEPNIARFWAPAPDPQRYAALLTSAHDAVASTGSSVPVVTGGLVPTSTSATSVSAADFLDKVYSYAGSDTFEGIGSHPYPRNAPYVDTMWKRLNILRAVRDERGDGATPLWITEVGISTDPTSGVGLDEQGDVLVSLHRSIEGHDVSSFVVHRLHDISYEGGFWNQTGVLYENLDPKPAYCELGAGIGTAC